MSLEDDIRRLERKIGSGKASAPDAERLAALVRLRAPEKDERPVQARVAARIRELRERRGLSQEALAKLTERSRSQVASVERGVKAPTLTTLDVFAKALGVSIAELVADGASVGNPASASDPAERLVRSLRERGPQGLVLVEALLRILDGPSGSGPLRSKRERGHPK